MIKKYSLIAFFALIGAYALFQGRFIILGPQVSIESPINESSVSVWVLQVVGTAKNVSRLTLNDRQIFTDTNGRFEEKLIVQGGINIIKLEALDRFGREKEFLVRVYSKQIN